MRLAGINYTWLNRVFIVLYVHKTYKYRTSTFHQIGPSSDSNQNSYMYKDLQHNIVISLCGEGFRMQLLPLHSVLRVTEVTEICHSTLMQKCTQK